MKNYYNILNIDTKASFSEIKKAYFTAIRKYTPDRFPDEFMQIREAYELLSNEKSRAEYDVFIEIPQGIRMLVEKGKETLEEGYPMEAVKYFEEANKKYPNTTFIQSMLGEAYFQNDNPVKAINIFERLVRENPKHAGYSGQLAHAYLSRGWQKKAINAYKKALSLDDDNISLWTGLSDAYHMNHEDSKARETIIKAIEMGKDKSWDNISLYFNLIQLDIINDEIEDMQIHLDDLTSLAVDQSDISENVGWTIFELAKIMVMGKLFTHAKEMIDKCTILLPNDINIKKAKTTIYDLSLIQNEFSSLEMDEDISQELTILIQSEFLPSEILNYSQKHKEFMNLVSKIEFLSCNFSDIKNEIDIIKARYPIIYDKMIDFFEKTSDFGKSKKLLASLEKQARKQQHLLKDIFADYDDEETEDLLDCEYTSQEPYVRQEEKIGRNDPCPCGSGKKYKKCCGR